METITRTLCPVGKRSRFLPRFVGRDCLCFERLVYSVMGRACDAYTGGYWDFYQLSNGGFYMGLSGYDRLGIVWSDNFFSGQLSADAASIGVTLMVLGWVCCDPQQPSRIQDHFYLLRSFALQHEEAGSILGFID